MIVDDLGRIPMSPSLASSLARASGYAEAQLHREVTLEHLLLALTEDPDAGVILTTSHIDLQRVVTDVSGLLGRVTEHNSPEEASRLAISADLKRILEAAAAASRGRRREINGAIVLAAIVGDGRTPAAHILRTQGLTFEDAIRVLQRAMAAPATPPPSARPQPIEPEPGSRDAPPPAAKTEDLLASARARVSRTRVEPPVVRQPPIPEPAGLAPPSHATVAGRGADVAAAEMRFPGAPVHEAPVHEAYVPAPQAPMPHVPEPPLASAQAPAPPPAAHFEAPGAADAGLRGDAEIDDETAAAAAYGYQQPDEARVAAPPLESRPAHEPDLQLELPRQSGPGVDYSAPPPPGPDEPSWMPPPLPRVERPALPPPLPPDARGGRPGMEPPRPVTPGASYPPPYPSFREPQVPPNPIYPPWPPVDIRADMRGQSPMDEAAPPPVPPADAVPPAPWPLPAEPAMGRLPSGHDPLRAEPALAPRPTQSPPAGFDDGPADGDTGAFAGSRSGEATQRGLPRVSGVTIGQLIENIPRAMRVAVPAIVEVRIAKADVKAVSDGMSGSTVHHEVMVTKAMSVRLRAPEGGFYIEAASPETQWLENTLGLMADDYASWRWTVTPRAKGRRRLQLVVAARTVGRDGLAAETALPEQVIDVRVATNYGLVARRWGAWIAAALIGGVLQHFADPLIAAGAKLANLLAAG